MTRLRFGLLIAVLTAVIWGTRPWWEQPAEIDEAQHKVRVKKGNHDAEPAEVPAANGLASTSDADSAQASGASTIVDQAVVPASANEPLDETAARSDAAAAETSAVDQTAAASAQAPQPVSAPDEIPGEPAKAASSPLAIDLLGRIDLERDVVKGDWQFDSGQLSSPPEVNQARVQIPVEPPAEYQLRLVVERGGHGKYTTLGIGLVGGGRQFYVLLDSNELGGSLGLDVLDGKSWNQNASTRRVSVFTDGVPAEVVCTVRKTGLSVQVDGREVLEWKGDFGRLSLYPAWAVPNKQQLFLGADCNYVFSQLTLSPLKENANESAASEKNAGR